MPDQSASPTKRRKRHPFQFGLKAVLILIVICAVVLAAWRTYVGPYRNQAEAIAVLKRLKAEYETRRAEVPAWFGWLVDPDDQIMVTRVSLSDTKLTPADAFYLQWLIHVEELHLGGTGVRDDDLERLRGLSN